MKTILLLTTLFFLSSCGVQQFAVNTTVEPFSNGGRVFGEMTQGSEFKKRRDFFIIGIAVNSSDTKKMAESLKATSYTIETKANLFTALTYVFTFGIVNYQIVKVIKRAN